MIPQELQEKLDDFDGRINSLKNELDLRDRRIKELEDKINKSSLTSVVEFKPVTKTDKAYINRIVNLVLVDDITASKTGGTAVIADGNHTVTIPDGGGNITITSKGGIITAIS